MMKVVAGLVINPNQEVLLTQRPEGKHLAGFWEFPGGKIEAGESEAEALKRELKEELDLQVEIVEKLGDFPFNYEKFEILLMAWICRPLSEPKQTSEIQNAKWIGPSEIMKETLAPADIPILESYLNRSNRGLPRIL